MARALFCVLLGQAGLAEPVAAEVVVAPGRTLDASAVEALLLPELPAPSEGIWTVRIVEPQLPMANPSQDDLSVGLASMDGHDLDPDAGRARVQGRLEVRDGQGQVAFVPFAAELQAMVELPVPLRPVVPGTILDGGMLGTTWLPRERVDDEMVRSVEETRRAEVARRLPAGRPILRAALRPPRAVRRGEPVLIVFTRGGLRLTITGRALEDAALGELVRAANPASSREVQGIVSGPGEVTLGGSVE